jgi:hypothetical protein
MKATIALCLLLLSSLMYGCASDRVRESIIRDAEAAGMTRVEIAVGGFTLTTYQRITTANAPVRVYVEGDGLAWITPTQPSVDPTPIHAIGLSLAALDPSPNVVYLARPCQYSMQHSPQCTTAYWTDKRFAEELVQAMDHALDVVMLAAPQQKIELVGYSGGAAMAVLLAARRSDVASLRSVAGNLDVAAVNRYHHVSAMPESLDPADFVGKIEKIPQRHFYGTEDKIIPVFVTESFAQRQHAACATVTPVPQANHQDGWQAQWADLLKLPVACR